jgi:DNA-directed RNA polymerase specialized sigma24 family protein
MFTQHRQDATTAQLAGHAVRGDERAWRHLVTRFEPMLRGVLRHYRLSHHDVDDVFQTTWLRAFKHLGRLDAPAMLDAPDWETGERVTIERERRTAVRTSVRRLRGRQRLLLRLLLDRPGLSYDEISAVLDMPKGSIGPTRDRAFTRMRADSRLQEAVSQ